MHAGGTDSVQAIGVGAVTVDSEPADAAAVGTAAETIRLAIQRIAAGRTRINAVTKAVIDAGDAGIVRIGSGLNPVTVAGVTDEQRRAGRAHAAVVRQRHEAGWTLRSCWALCTLLSLRTRRPLRSGGTWISLRTLRPGWSLRARGARLTLLSLRPSWAGRPRGTRVALRTLGTGRTLRPLRAGGPLVAGEREQGIRRRTQCLPRRQRRVTAGLCARPYAHLDPQCLTVIRHRREIEVRVDQARTHRDVIDVDRVNGGAAARGGVQRELEVVAAVGRHAGVGQLALVGELAAKGRRGCPSGKRETEHERCQCTHGDSLEGGHGSNPLAKTRSVSGVVLAGPQKPS